MTISIKRPTITVIRTNSGKAWTYKVECDHWGNDYVRLSSGVDLSKVTKCAEAFGAQFDDEATVIEDEQRGRGIMRAYVANLFFVAIPKVPKSKRGI